LICNIEMFWFCSFFFLPFCSDFYSSFGPWKCLFALVFNSFILNLIKLLYANNHRFINLLQHFVCVSFPFM
jgi:hypothetical protein